VKTREAGRVVVAAGEGITEPLLIQWWLWKLIHVVVAGNEGTVEGKERLVEGCSDLWGVRRDVDTDGRL